MTSFLHATNSIAQLTQLQRVLILVETTYISRKQRIEKKQTHKQKSSGLSIVPFVLLNSKLFQNALRDQAYRGCTGLY